VSLASENRFPERWEGAARDSVRMRQRPVCMQEFREELGTRWSARNFRPYCGIALLLVRSADGARQQNTRACGQHPVDAPSARTDLTYLRFPF
jgi:hypothetical protein